MNPGNLLEVEIAPGNTGYLLEFSWCTWKIFLISSLTSARLVTFSTLYIGKSSGKQDHYDLRGYCMACHVKIFWNLKEMYPGNLLKIGSVGFVDVISSWCESFVCFRWWLWTFYALYMLNLNSVKLLPVHLVVWKFFYTTTVYGHNTGQPALISWHPS